MSKTTAPEAGALDRQGYTFDDAVQDIKDGRPNDDAVSKLLAQLSHQEQLSLLDGDEPFWQGLGTILCDRYNRVPFVMGAIPRLKIPGIKFTDGPRGIVMGASTCFPVSMSRGATWDTDLEKRIGNAIGLEGRAQGANYFAGICINLPRHPAWGRIQETYSEDPILLGEFGLALHEGVKPHLMTCVKHYALNSMEIARFRVDVKVDDAALHEVYLPHFRQLVKGGVSSVMSSYNSVRGEFAGQNYELLTKILREQWKFDGFVLSDFIFGLRDAALSVKNGLDIEAPFAQQRDMHLQKAIDAENLQWSHVGTACTRILRKQLQHVATTGYEFPENSVIFCDAHRKLAREAAAKGMVLLKNEQVDVKPLLPLDSSTIKSVAIVGRLANTNNTGDRGYSAVFAPKVVTAYEGIKAALPNAQIQLSDTDSVEEAEKIAGIADLVICIVGYDAGDEGEYVVPSFETDPVLLDLFPPTKSDEDRKVEALLKESPATSKPATKDSISVGEGGDRKSLRLRPRDVEIIDVVSRANSNTVVSIIAAGAVIMEEWVNKIPAVLMMWYSGSEGGHSFADVLLGNVDASGRLPFSIPRSEDHLPFLDVEASSIEYDRWFGQRLLDKLGEPARYPLGYGLSYTSFEASDLSVDKAVSQQHDEKITVKAKISNVGDRAGRYIAQIYGLTNGNDFPSRVLLGFKPIDLASGQSKVVEILCSTRPLQRWREGTFVLVDQELDIELASSSGDSGALKARVHL
jgi:beta-glucosidase-like glycosyl hydrolase